ncbi:MAG: hypothetical protein WBA42_18095 [Mesorhizobium sp.]
MVGGWYLGAVREDRLHQRHQERFYRVQFGGPDGRRSRKIIDDAKGAFTFIVLLMMMWIAAHGDNMPMNGPEFLATGWSS